MSQDREHLGTSGGPEDLPGELPWDASPDWTPPETSGISEEDFPIDCVNCGHRLSGLQDSGQCPNCGREFVRAERLLELHGPEVFVPEDTKEVRPPERLNVRKRDVVLAAVITAVAVAAGLSFPSLIAAGVVESDRWGFILILLVAAIAAWLRAFHRESD